GQIVDGVMVIAPIQSTLYDDLAHVYRGLPFIQIGTQMGTRAASVVIDQEMGGRIATQHLIDLGHQRIAEISGPLNWYDAIERHTGWLATLEANKLTPVATEQGQWTAASGYEAAQRLIEGGSEFTALVIGNDQMALGAIRAFKEHG